MDRLRKILLYGGLTKEEFTHVKENCDHYNIIALKGLLPIIMWVFLSMFMINAVAHFENTATQIVIGITSMALVVERFVFAMLLEDKPQRVTLCMYIGMATLYLMTIIQSMVQPSLPTVSFVVLLVALPIAFTDIPIRQIIAGSFASALYIILSYHFENSQIALFDSIEVIMFLFIGTMASIFLIPSRIQAFYQDYHMRLLSEIDLLTGIKNRNCYEKDIQSLQGDLPPIFVIVYVDADGLHSLNNEKGHHAGDEMLIHIAHTLRNHFGEAYTYRLGGDEFVGISFNDEIDEVSHKMKIIAQQLMDEGIHISYGISTGQRQDLIEDVVRDAEHQMYKQKRAYYAHTVHDRRQREARI